jgi:hypothetical protein
MCNKKIYSVDLQTDATGIINVNVSQLAQDLIGVPLSITVKQIIMQLDNTTASNPDLTGNIGLRICHNITTRNFGNMVGGSSNVLGFIDNFSVRTHATGILFGTTTPDLKLYAPYGLPSQLILTRTWNTNATSFDNISTLYTDEPFFVRLEIERLDEKEEN